MPNLVIREIFCRGARPFHIPDRGTKSETAMFDLDQQDAASHQCNDHIDANVPAISQRKTCSIPTIRR